MIIDTAKARQELETLEAELKRRYDDLNALQQRKYLLVHHLLAAELYAPSGCTKDCKLRGTEHDHDY